MDFQFGPIDRHGAHSLMLNIFFFFETNREHMIEENNPQLRSLNTINLTVDITAIGLFVSLILEGVACSDINFQGGPY